MDMGQIWLNASSLFSLFSELSYWCVVSIFFLLIIPPLQNNKIVYYSYVFGTVHYDLAGIIGKIL